MRAHRKHTTGTIASTSRVSEPCWVERHPAEVLATATRVHVIADARHQDVALDDDMVSGLVAQEPLVRGDAVFAAHVLAAWARCESSLFPPGPPHA